MHMASQGTGDRQTLSVVSIYQQDIDRTFRFTTEMAGNVQSGFSPRAADPVVRRRTSDVKFSSAAL